MKRIAVIGYGAIGRAIVEELSGDLSSGLKIVGVLARPAQLADRSALPETICFTTEIKALLALEPDIVVEAAGHQAVRDFAEPILERGMEFHILSVGVLADQAWKDDIEALAERTGGRIVLPAGALGGFDALLSLRAGGLRSVTYVSTKPPKAWRGTEAEERFDLDALTSPTVLLEASAREAARRFPRNANLAAAVALAGLGLDQTQVRLVADPSVTTNIGSMTAHGTLGDLAFSLEGAGDQSNPKTSQVTAYSVVAGLRNAVARISFL